ncbi:MAG TPA: patatin-like phospholipase family protein [Ktedonobacteraceae bacterium]|nr:patatin-like phospholipase family protein [Ktedonobacteraceae bacterium]
MDERISPVHTSLPDIDLVLEGGGVRGIGHVGALSVLEEQGYRWVNIAGTSAGAFVASLLAANYSAKELYEIMRNEVDFHRFAQDKGLDNFFLVEGLHLLMQGGLHTGSYIQSFMREKLLAAKPKPISTFGDLIVPGREEEPKDSMHRYRLTVVASDISQGLLLRLPQDMLKFGQDPDKLEVALAVRMSASIPFFFLPMKQRRQDGKNDLVVDGALLSNFPVGIFDVPGKPHHPTLGLELVDNAPGIGESWPIHATGNILEIGQALISTMTSAHDRLYMDNATFVRTIAIPVEGISGTKFDLTEQEAEKLYQNGRKAAQDFLSTWDFEAYKAVYRSDRPHTGRRQQLHEEMKRLVPA